ncbi:MAE_28990/MAE_18760 family HEPN-like nuclease [Corynebacterium simulans]|uniref:MAE_28990/MAE_18760 family HEPN-like nuclease n=1 Tax=Corynebacterium simulans TaxID=146827 RepID=UPI00254AA597|nr:MAE_28990/MAE_18760 family HEPN-like nuclease [Corynebacterium simulans]MDK7140073.1 MAE_28990/MAE_18760 family HEPN-like nuclease [Corynebacterium simulans]
MKRNFSDLQDRLAKESAWRKRELLYLRQQLGLNYQIFSKKSEEGGVEISYEYVATLEILETQKEPEGPPAQTKRALFLMVYAHWEGFIKHSIKVYLHYLSYLREDERPFHPTLFRKLLINRLASQKEKAECLPKKDADADLSQIVQLSPFDSTKGVRLQIDDATIEEFSNTNSNLDFEQLTQLIESLNLPFPDFFTQNRPIINTLRRIRNGISHGDPAEEFVELPADRQKNLPKAYEFVIKSFEEFTQLLIDSADRFDTTVDLSSST